MDIVYLMNLTEIKKKKNIAPKFAVALMFDKLMCKIKMSLEVYIYILLAQFNIHLIPHPS